MVEIIHEMWRYRALVAALVRRHLSVRYRGSLLGYLWSLLNPLALMLVYTLVFQYYIRFSAVDHYTIFLFCGLLPWIWLSSGLIEGTQSITSSGHLITKSMFPAHLLPLVAVITSMVHFLLALPLLLLFMLVAGVAFSWTILLLPLCIVVQGIFLLGATLATSALNVRFRDVQHIVVNLLTFLFFLCPVIYPSSTVPEAWRFTITLNPLAGFIEAYHDLIFRGTIPGLEMTGYVGVWAVAMFAFGAIVYQRNRDTFAELL